VASDRESTSGVARIDPDRNLVHAAREGDYEAFEQLVARHEQGLYTLAMRILQRSQDAEEVVQETFLSVVEHLKDFREASLFRTWLVRIATNHALRILGKRRGLSMSRLEEDGEDDERPMPHPEFVAEWKADPRQISEQRETREILSAALGELPEKYRMAFLLRDVEGLTTDETAEAMGISVGNVKIRLLRARLMLRERLTRVFGDEGGRIAVSHEHEE